MYAERNRSYFFSKSNSTFHEAVFSFNGASKDFPDFDLKPFMLPPDEPFSMSFFNVESEIFFPAIVFHTTKLQPSLSLQDMPLEKALILPFLHFGQSHTTVPAAIDVATVTPPLIISCVKDEAYSRISLLNASAAYLLLAINANFFSHTPVNSALAMAFSFINS